ncbi:MAG TPA: DinB family protein [Micromonosporaceae bacterium]
MARFADSDEFHGADFVDLDMSRAVFRQVDLSGSRMRGVLLTGADIDGVIHGLTVNGIEVAPLVEAELDRRHPERITLRSTTLDGMRDAWTVIESFWATTVQRAGTLSEADLHRSVDDEWTFTQTLRHLVFVTDAWLSHAVLGRSRPFHPLGLPASFIKDAATLGIDPDADPAFDEVVEVRAGRMAQVRRFLETASQEELARTREPNTAPGWPPPAMRTATSCLHVLFNEEWAHHRFAERDLAVIDA